MPRRPMRDRLLELFWPWERIRRLKVALTQALADNEELRARLDKLTDRDDIPLQ